MSGSFPVFDAVVQGLMARLAPQRAVEVGFCIGRYGQILAATAPDCHRAGIELDPALAGHEGQESPEGRHLHYATVHAGDARSWWRQHPHACFDLIILGDCLGYLPKSEGLDLLNFLVHRCAYLVAVAGEFPALGSPDDPIPNVPMSVWSERDLAWHDRWAWDNCRATTLMVLRGYQSSPVALHDLVDNLNGADLPVHHFDGQTFVRPARLRLCETRREVDYRQL